VKWIQRQQGVTGVCSRRQQAENFVSYSFIITVPLLFEDSYKPVQLKRVVK